MNIVIVGAGAVGAVLGRHFQRGGAMVTFLVRARHKEILQEGIVLHPLNETRAPEGILWREFAVETEVDSPALHEADVVFFTVPSPALQTAGFVAGIVRAAPLATFAGIQPGPHDASLVRREAGTGQVVWGMFSLMSFSTGAVAIGATRAGTAYWRPPGAALGFAGEEERVRPILETLRRGGMPSKRSRDFNSELAVGDAVLSSHTMALEAARWSFAVLRGDSALLRTASVVCGEMLQLAKHRLAIKIPFFVRFLGPFTSRLLLRVAPWIAPFSLEQFFHAHYEKVSEQTLSLLDANIALAQSAGLAHVALHEMRTRLIAVRK